MSPNTTATSAPSVRPEIDLSETERFLNVFTGYDDASTRAVLDFAYLEDVKGSGTPIGRKRGTLAEVCDQLVEANQKGSGVFFTVNETDGKGFNAPSIIKLRYAFIDVDGNDPPVTREVVTASGLPPTITVQSGHGQHNYWALVEGTPLEEFTPLQKALAKKFNTDPIVCDLPRLMRLPGFIHQKDPANPFLVTLVATEDVEYTIDEIYEAFKLTKDEAPTAIKLNGLPKTDAAKAPKLTAKTKDDIDRARKYVAKMPAAISGKGGNNATYKAAAVFVRNFGLEGGPALELLKEYNTRCEPPWSEEELIQILENAYSYGKADVGAALAKADDSGLKAALLRGQAARPTEVTPVTEAQAPDGGGRPVRPGWNNQQFSDKKGPLVHYAPGKGSKDKDSKDKDSKDKDSKDGKDNEKEEWVQVQPTKQMIANAARLLALYCSVDVVAYSAVGNKFFEISPANLAKEIPRELLRPAVREICHAMMGEFEPTPETFLAAEQHILSLPKKGTALALTRWKGESMLALHEMPVPKEGDWSAHKEFLDRCSCPDTVKAWTASCFMPEEKTGREALLLFGNGNDGKSQWCRALMQFLGPVAAASEILNGDNRFELHNLINKRLVYFGDFRNPRPIHSKKMREIIAGADLYVEGKGKDGCSVYFHPRCLMSTNVEPLISRGDVAEYSRVRRINVRPLADNPGDHSWPKKLLAQMPAFLFECQKVYQRMVLDGCDLPYTQACKDALAGGEAALDENFEYLAERLEVTGDPEDFVKSSRVAALIEAAHYKGWQAHDARKWLKDKGATATTQWDAKAKKAAKVWLGVRETGVGIFPRPVQGRLAA